MRQFNVTGMSCAACSARVEKAVNGVEGVTACSVSLLTNSMGVEGTASDAAIQAAVEAAGYGASPKGAARIAAPEEDALVDRETPVLKKRLLSSLGKTPHARQSVYAGALSRPSAFQALFELLQAFR